MMASEINKLLDELIDDFKYLADFLKDLLIELPTYFWWDSPEQKKKVEQCGNIYEKYFGG